MSTPILLAFSGGLDTTYCLVKLQAEGYTVHTATVDTGGFSPEELTEITEKSAQLGAASHTTLDGRQRLYDEMVCPLLLANYQKGGNYPACVGAERVTTAIMVAELAQEKNINTIVHGSTGAGNDQVRFDVALRALLPGVEIMTPIRDQQLSRADSTAYLRSQGVTVDDKTTDYSVNVGIVGTTIGGKETHDTQQNLPASAYPHVVPSDQATPTSFTLTLTRGLPTALNGQPSNGLQILQQLNVLGAAAGFGAGHHIGTTILGLKGRIGFEAPGMRLLNLAKRELEKITLTGAQQFWKATLGQKYGDMIHEGLYFDPLRRDLEAFLRSACTAVSGDITVDITHGNATVTSLSSPRSLLAAQGGMYGEGADAWSGADAAGFCRLYGYEGVLAYQVDQAQSNS